MADVFVSYDRDDQDRVAKLVELLEAQGWSVFWDRDIPPGESWRSLLGSALERASCVLVLWTERSIVSDWVAEEADFARQKDILIPVLLDRVTPPLGFRTIQAASLLGWPNAVDPASVEEILHTVASIVGARTRQMTSAKLRPEALDADSPRPATSSAAISALQRPHVLALVAVLASIMIAGASLLVGGWDRPDASRRVDPVGPGSLAASSASEDLGPIDAVAAGPDRAIVKVQGISGRTLPIRSKILPLTPSAAPLRGRTE